jgi:hypothetical protein
MSERAPYSRVYWSVMDDAKFDGIREDVRLFGSWSLLLVVADMAHPVPAYLPRTVPKGAVTRLSECGLIDLLAGHRYRIHGLDAERTRRRVAATRLDPTGPQERPKRDPDGQQAKQSKDEAEQRRAEADARDPDDGRVDLEAFLVIRRHAPSPAQRRVLDGVLDRHDQTGPQWAADVMYRNPEDPIGAVIEADKTWRAERIAEAQSAEKPKPKHRASNGLPEATRDLLDHWATEKKAELKEKKTGATA